MEQRPRGVAGAEHDHAALAGELAAHSPAPARQPPGDEPAAKKRRPADAPAGDAAQAQQVALRAPLGSMEAHVCGASGSGQLCAAPAPAQAPPRDVETAPAAPPAADAAGAGVAPPLRAEAQDCADMYPPPQGCEADAVQRLHVRARSAPAVLRLLTRPRAGGRVPD